MKIAMLAVSCGLSACATPRPGADGGAVTIAPTPPPRIKPVGKMTLRPIADGKLITTEHGTYLFGCHPITVSRVDRGATTPMPALEKALLDASVACVDALDEPIQGRLLVSALLEEGETAWLGWSGAAIERTSPPREARPARLVAPVEESGDVSEATLRGEIAVEPASRYPRAPTPVKRLRGQIALPGGALVVIGHLDDGSLAAEVWNAPGERGRAEALPAAPPWSSWDPSLAPRAARVASAGAGHACVVPTAIAETLSHRYLACYDGSWSEVDTSPLDGVIASLGGAEGWIWATSTMTTAPGVFRMPLGGRWERVGLLPEDALETQVKVRSAREVYVSAGGSNWVALEAP